MGGVNSISGGGAGKWGGEVPTKIVQNTTMILRACMCHVGGGNEVLDKVARGVWHVIGISIVWGGGTRGLE